MSGKPRTPCKQYVFVNVIKLQQRGLHAARGPSRYLVGSEALGGGVVLPTLLAAEGFLLRVAELVLLQVAHLVELLPAGGAPVPPLSDLRVPRETRLLGDAHGLGPRPLCEGHGRTVNAPRFGGEARAAADGGASVRRRKRRRRRDVTSSARLSVTRWDVAPSSLDPPVPRAVGCMISLDRLWSSFFFFFFLLFLLFLQSVFCLANGRKVGAGVSVVLRLHVC